MIYCQVNKRIKRSFWCQKVLFFLSLMLEKKTVYFKEIHKRSLWVLVACEKKLSIVPIKVVYPRHLLLKCLYQASEVNSRIYVSLSTFVLLDFGIVQLLLINKGLSWSWSYGSWIYNNMHVQSASITTKVVGSNPVHGEGYSIQHYAIKFICQWLTTGR